MKIVTILCGKNHTVAICDNEDIYVTGGNFSGQLGLGKYEVTSKNEIKLIHENCDEWRQTYSCQL